MADTLQEIKDLERMFLAADKAGDKKGATLLLAEIERLDGTGQAGASSSRGAGGNWEQAQPSKTPEQISAYRKYISLEGVPGGEAEAKKALAIYAGNNFRPIDISNQEAGSMGIRASGPAIGQSIGAATGPAAPVAVPVLGFLGGAGSEYVAQGREGGPKRPGAIFGAGFAGMWPGVSLAKAGGGAVVREGVKQGAVNYGAKAVETLVDGTTNAETGVVERGLPSLKEGAFAVGAGVASAPLSKVFDAGAGSAATQQARGHDLPRATTIKMGRAAGYVFPPASINADTTLGDLGNYAASSQAFSHKASINNQKAANALARKYAGLGADEALDEKSIAAAISRESKPYDEIASLSNQAEANLEGMKQARADAKALYKQYDAKAEQGIASPELREAAKQQEKLAELFEDELEIEARRLGKVKLVGEMKVARKNLAQIHMVDRALNPSAGDVSSASFGFAHDADPELLTGEALTIARMAKAFPHITVERSKLTPPSSGKIPGVESLLKKGVLSDRFQSMLAKPHYGSELPDIAGSLAKFGTMNAGREDHNRIPYFLRKPQ